MSTLNLAPELLAAGYSLSYKDGVLYLSKMEGVGEEMVELNYSVFDRHGMLIVQGASEPMEYLNWCFWHEVTNFMAEGNYRGPNSKPPTKRSC